LQDCDCGGRSIRPICCGCDPTPGVSNGVKPCGLAGDSIDLLKKALGTGDPVIESPGKGNKLVKVLGEGRVELLDLLGSPGRPTVLAG